MPGETMITDAAPASAPAAPAAAPAPAAPAAAPAPADGASQATPAAGAAPAGAGDAPAEAKTAEQIAADAAAAEAAAKPPGAPEKYEDFAAPEGATLDAKVMEKFADAARELNLPQDAAQKMVDKMAPLMAARQAEQIEQLRTDWAAQSTGDKEFGGDKLQENLVHAKRALETFATPELKTILNETGLGNHPELVRFMVRAGKAISEDKIVTGGQPASTRSAADVLYGGPKK